jgi:hypothetical protein
MGGGSFDMDITGNVLVNARANLNGIIDLVSTNKYSVTPIGAHQTTLKPNDGKFNQYGIHLKNGMISCTNILDNISASDDGTVSIWIKTKYSKMYIYGSFPSGIYSHTLNIFCNGNDGDDPHKFGFCSAGYDWTYKGDTLSFDEWHHVAFTRSNGTSYFFRDGKLVWSGSFPYPILAGNRFQTDLYGVIDINTYKNIFTKDAVYDDIIVIKGQALWTSDFELPTNYITGVEATSFSSPLIYDNTLPLSTAKQY